MLIKNRNRWPNSLHSQCEAVFHAIREIRSKKIDNPRGIRSFGAWRTYKYESHRFVQYMSQKGRDNILKVKDVQDDMADYLQERLTDYAANKRSRQTFETILAALGKFEFAVNRYLEIHLPSDHPKLSTEQTRMSFYKKSKQLLKKSSRAFENRAYPYPIGLIEVLHDGTYQLQAAIQYEGGLRAEGVGAPSNQLKNPLTEKCLRGVTNDPVTGLPAGVIVSKEKGGKETEHYISVQTYQRLEEHISMHGKLESNYFEYIKEINKAARATNQYASGKASHGLKHNFAEERYSECVAHGMTHERALQNTSLELAHFRLRETLSYTRGR